MATPFSWSDTIHIVFSCCLPCLERGSGEDSSNEQDDNGVHNSAINRIPRARADELQGLLADPDTDIEAETLSLHSNPGRGGRKSKKKRRSKTNKNKDGNPRRITLFGYDLYGRTAPPPIQLPDDDDDDDDALYESSRRARSGSGNGNESEGASGTSGRLTSNTTIRTAHSTATFDSDAAPLDADAIAAMSSPTAIATAAAQAADVEAQRLREKEERRQRRKEKKELRRMAEALAAQNPAGDADDAFEGFQGSGNGALPNSNPHSGYPRIPNTMFPRGPLSNSDSGSASGSGFSGSAADSGFGRFVEAPAAVVSLPILSPLGNDEDDETADLDGGMYSRHTPRGAPGASRSTSNGSDSRSRTSASRSDRAHQFPDPRNVVAHIQSNAYNTHSSSRVTSPSPLQTQFQPPQPDSSSSASASASALSFVTAASNLTSVPSKPKTKSKSSKSSSSRTSRSAHSSTTASQSPSLPSPISPSFAQLNLDATVVSPSTIEQGQGFFDLEDEIAAIHKAKTQSRSRKGSSAYTAQFVKNDIAPPPPQESTARTQTQSASTFPTTRIGGGTRDGFPSTGFGGGGAGRARDFGAFLARRGDDEGNSNAGEGL